MILLPNGCSYSGLSVTPKNWKTHQASIERDWYIYYRFYSPDCKKGKLKIIKGGINGLKTLSERREAVQALLKIERELLEKKGFNPVQNRIFTQRKDYIIPPETRFIDALKASYKRLDYEASTMSDLRSIIRGTCKAAGLLNMSSMEISEIRRRHIIAVLDKCSEIVESWSRNRYNKYKSYLSILFKELVNIEAIESNPLKEIEKKVVVKKARIVLTHGEREIVDRHLKTNYYTFWRFLQIFFHSGARETELMKLRKNKVFLDQQYFWVTIMKGGQPQEVKKSIKDIIKPLWLEVFDEALENQFLFSKELRPGEYAISPRQITRRWKAHVKDKLNIQADFYSLKHLNIDEVTDILSIEHAAKMASHTNTKTTASVYAVGKEERDRLILQTIANKFA